MRDWIRNSLSRRNLLSASALAAAGAGLATLTRTQPVAAQSGHGDHGTRTAASASDAKSHAHGNAKNGFDPSSMLTDWETGTLSQLPDGRQLRTYEVTGEDKEIEIIPGVFFPAWTYNGRVPGPTLRATEGDRLRIVFRNNGSHPHTMHFHGIHSARMDGIPRGW